MFTVPNGGKSSSVADGVTWQATKELNSVGASQATASGTFDQNGAVVLIDDITPNGLGWYNEQDAGIGASHWIRASVLSGSSPNGGDSLNTWLALSSARQWSWATSGTDTIRVRSGVLKIDISVDAGGSVIVGTNTLSGYAAVDNS